MAVVALPNFIVIQSLYHTDDGNAYYNTDNSVVLGEQDVLSTPVKVAVEPSTSNNNYVHLRFVYNNGYWARNVDDTFINVASKQPVEDITNPACTLYEPIFVGDGEPNFYLRHVQTGGRLGVNNDSLAFYVDETSGDVDANLGYVDWESLVKLPAHVAFKGDNDMYLQATVVNDTNALQFASSNPNETISGHQVSQMNDGRVQITSDFYGKMWWSQDDWVYGDWSNEWDPESAIFTPLIINEGNNTIALRSNGPYSNNYFCKRVIKQAMISCLAPATPDIDQFSRLVLQELVQERTIYDAVYDMASARIYNETPHVAGKTVLMNNTEADATMTAEITYQNEISCTFSGSVSLTAGVETTFQVGVPIVEKSGIVISFDVDAVLHWDTTTTTTTSVTVSQAIPVPAWTSLVVEYVGTKATCNVPFSYSQKDVRSTDGITVTTNQTDGIYTGVNSYNFNFVVISTRPGPTLSV